MSTAASAQRSPTQQAAELMRMCGLPAGTLVPSGDKVVVLSDKLPDLEANFGCLLRSTLRKPGWENVIYADSESKIDEAIERDRQVERSRALRPQRIEKVKRLLAAIKRGDRAAVQDEGVLGKPYALGFERAPQPRAVGSFTVDSLAEFAACTPGRPSSGNVGWLTVQWDCPEDTPQPWTSTATSFKFDELEIVFVQTTPGPPLVRPVPPPEPHPISTAGPTP